MGGGPATPATPPPAPAPEVKKAEPASEVLRRKRIAAGRSSVSSTGGIGETSGAAKSLLGQ